ncbi:hypothetical protein [Yersinia pseudotuberculosis]|uniref:hypothetical protein n=1 Tax=Yersinia pseudotuberculosis TaxID=633 RepID=UPI000F507457|nr:hypothetical protein [Yersinia pseudotuberculosis]AYX15427.1 hypothetical protein EGX44_09620 [Yersinia pseudotuberculosis]
MTQMVYRHGDMKKWKGVGYDFEIIRPDELDEYLDAGWFAHPDDLLKSSAEPEPEPEPEPETPKKTRKKAATDEPND